MDYQFKKKSIPNAPTIWVFLLLVIFCSLTTLSVWYIQTIHAQNHDIQVVYKKRQKEVAAAVAKREAARNTALHDYNSPSIVINKKHCFSPSNWAPSSLSYISSSEQMQTVAATQFKLMLADAEKSNAGFSPSSGYRTYADQVKTYNYWVSYAGQTEADLASARPGCSEHQTGLAVDLKQGNCVLECFADTTAYQWLTEHAVAYGFIQRYQSSEESVTGYKAEPWHWRYVGAVIIKDMKRTNAKTLEDYYDIDGGDYT